MTDWPGFSWDLAKYRMVNRRGWTWSGSWAKNLVRAGVKRALRAVFNEHCLFLKLFSISKGRPAWREKDWIVCIASSTLLICFDGIGKGISCLGVVAFVVFVVVVFVVVVVVVVVFAVVLVTFVVVG